MEAKPITYATSAVISLGRMKHERLQGRINEFLM